MAQPKNDSQVSRLKVAYIQSPDGSRIPVEPLQGYASAKTYSDLGNDDFVTKRILDSKVGSGISNKIFQNIGGAPLTVAAPDGYSVGAVNAIQNGQPTPQVLSNIDTTANTMTVDPTLGNVTLIYY